MKRLLTTAAIALALIAPAAPAALANPHGCPPGLAKKNPPCVPPGQAKKWAVGDRYDGRYEPIGDWWRYRLTRPGRDENWVRVGDTILKVNDETKLVIDIIRLADRIYN